LKTALIKPKLITALGLHPFARVLYARNDKIDLAFETNYIEKVMPNAKPLNEVELASIQVCKDGLSACSDDSKWKRMGGTLNDSIGKYKYQLEGGRVAVKGDG